MSGLCSAPAWITASMPRSAKSAVDQSPVGDRADHIGVGARRDVEAGHLMACGAQARREEPAEPAGRAGQQEHAFQAAADTGVASRSAGSCASAQSVRRFSHGVEEQDGSLRNSSSEWMKVSIARSHHFGSRRPCACSQAS